MTKMSAKRKAARGISTPPPQTPERPRPQFSCASCPLMDSEQPTQPFCRRFPAQLVVVQRLNDQDSGLRKFFPIVDPIYDWCGEHPEIKKRMLAN